MNLPPFNAPLTIGSLTIPGRAVLAPLCGITDEPFRRICSEMGAALTFTEMISAVAVTYQNKRTFEMLRRHQSEKILGAQLEGNDPAAIASTVKIFDSLGFDIIDINMGCPVRKVVNAGGGSALLQNPELISRILDAARKVTSRPLSVKYRIGFTHERISVEDTTQRALDAGFQMVTIHGRTRSDDYSKAVQLQHIARGVRIAHEKSLPHSKVVALGNGNIFSFSRAQHMREITNCDGVMISRGVMGNPWIFRDLQLGQAHHVSIEEWLELVLRHINYQQEAYGDTQTAAVLMRKHLLSYAKGFPGTKQLRGEICTRTSLDALRTLMREFCKNHPSHLMRAPVSEGDSGYSQT